MPLAARGRHRPKAISGQAESINAGCMTARRRGMKFPLTPAGIRSKSMLGALLGTPGMPAAQAGALCVPAAAYALPGGGEEM